MEEVEKGEVRAIHNCSYSIRPSKLKSLKTQDFFLAGKVAIIPLLFYIFILLLTRTRITIHIEC